MRGFGKRVSKPNAADTDSDLFIRLELSHAPILSRTNRPHARVHRYLSENGENVRGCCLIEYEDLKVCGRIFRPTLFELLFVSAFFVNMPGV
jgi:hypothetical protein